MPRGSGSSRRHSRVVVAKARPLLNDEFVVSLDDDLIFLIAENDYGNELFNGTFRHKSRLGVRLYHTREDSAREARLAY